LFFHFYLFPVFPKPEEVTLIYQDLRNFSIFSIEIFSEGGETLRSSHRRVGGGEGYRECVEGFSPGGESQRHAGRLWDCSGYLATDYERFMRRKCEWLPINPVHQVSFVLGEKTEKDRNMLFCIYYLWTKKKLPRIDGDEISNAFSFGMITQEIYQSLNP
jgi:hypothetical protein